MTTLTDLDKQIITTEAQTFATRGGKERAILNLGMRPTHYYQHLNRLLDNPAAQAHDPITINRIRRQRDHRRAQKETTP